MPWPITKFIDQPGRPHDLWDLLFFQLSRCNKSPEEKWKKENPKRRRQKKKKNISKPTRRQGQRDKTLEGTYV
jgi:hypothetical protein